MARHPLAPVEHIPRPVLRYDASRHRWWFDLGRDYTPVRDSNDSAKGRQPHLVLHEGGRA